MRGRFEYTLERRGLAWVLYWIGYGQTWFFDGGIDGVSVEIRGTRMNHGPWTWASAALEALVCISLWLGSDI